jgi:hypothetical protein
MRAIRFGRFGGVERFRICGEYSPTGAALLSAPSNQTAKKWNTTAPSHQTRTQIKHYLKDVVVPLFPCVMPQ